MVPEDRIHRGIDLLPYLLEREVFMTMVGKIPPNEDNGRVQDVDYPDYFPGMLKVLRPYMGISNKHNSAWGTRNRECSNLNGPCLPVHIPNKNYATYHEDAECHGTVPEKTPGLFHYLTELLGESRSNRFAFR